MIFHINIIRNVYACLVCGTYFQGRGKNSYAYFHALEISHHVFINLETQKIYCLPDGYEVFDPSLDDIKVNFILLVMTSDSNIYIYIYYF